MSSYSSANSGGKRRRTTLCTEDGREIVPPQLPSFPWETRSKALPSGGHAPRPAVSRAMTIDVRLAEDGQRLRPLPRVPTSIPPAPKSAPPVPPQQFPRNPLPSPPLNQFPRSPPPRPLPSLLPQSPPPRPLPTPPSSGIAFFVIPATPLSPPTPALESSTHLSVPCARPGPPRFSSLKVQTSPDALEARAFETRKSPATPMSPELPSPRTVQRKRINKLRRHLGESVQMVLESPDNADVLAGLRHSGNEDACPVVSITVESVLDSGTDSEASSDSEADDTVDYFSLTSLSHRPSSRKWIRENGKARWTEDDFTKVLQDLRSL